MKFDPLTVFFCFSFEGRGWPKHTRPVFTLLNPNLCLSYTVKKNQRITTDLFLLYALRKVNNLNICNVEFCCRPGPKLPSWTAVPSQPRPNSSGTVCISLRGAWVASPGIFFISCISHFFLNGVPTVLSFVPLFILHIFFGTNTNKVKLGLKGTRSRIVTTKDLIKSLVAMEGEAGSQHNY